MNNEWDNNDVTNNNGSQGILLICNKLDAIPSTMHSHAFSNTVYAITIIASIIIYILDMRKLRLKEIN